MNNREVLKQIIKDDYGIEPYGLKISSDDDFIYYAYKYSENSSWRGNYKQKISISYFKQKKREYKLNLLWKK